MHGQIFPKLQRAFLFNGFPTMDFLTFHTSLSLSCMKSSAKKLELPFFRVAPTMGKMFQTTFQTKRHLSIFLYYC